MSTPIPSSGTVLSMVGLNFNKAFGSIPADYMPQALQSVFSTPPYTMQKVAYLASTSPKSISGGVANFNTAVRAPALAGVQKIGFMHSQGCQAATRWMRLYADDPTAPGPDELMFVLIGNLLRSTGGYAIGRTEVDGLTALPTPTDTPWNIVDIARRYDGWPDWVTDDTNEMAAQNANSGKNSFHLHYEVVELFDPDNPTEFNPAHTVWEDGNTTYVLTQESPPYFKSLSRNISDSLKSSIREKIESAYSNRPVNDPPVEPNPPLGWWALLRKFLLGA